MTKHRVARWLMAGALVLSAGEARAKSLSQKMSEQLNPAFSIDVPNLGTVDVQPAADFLVPMIQQLAIQGADFPSTSTTPGATFVYNPQLGAFERSPSLGPVFVERAETVGANRFEVGLSYLYANLDEIDGGGFGTFGGTSTLFCEQPLGPNGQCPSNAIGAVNNTLTMEKFNLRYSVFNLSGTYGITDRWDVNIFLPLIYTKLSARERVNARAFDVSSGVALGSSNQTVLSVSGSHFGVGDLLLRTKYRFLDEPLGMAAELVLRLPTGSQENFQGLGDVVLTPSLVMSRGFGPLDVHANLGMAFNTDDLERTQARYDIGVSYQVIDQLALLLDLVGSSGLDDDQFTVNGVGTAPRGVKIVRGAAFPFTGQSLVAIPRGDNVNIVPGLKFSIADRVVAFAEAIVPVTDDGLRASVLPTAGIEVGF
jgi:outer membrane putative beta-barrel porin/alpha-amylase